MRLFTYIFISFVIVGCSAKQKKKEHNDEYEYKVEVIKKMIDKSNEDVSIQYALMNLDLYKNDIPFFGTAVVYVIDSICSLCISSLIDFATILRGADQSIPLCVIIPENSRHIVNYYISKSGFKDTDVRIISGTDSLYTESVWAEQNSMVYVINNGCIKNGFSFIKLQQSIKDEVKQ